MFIPRLQFDRSWLRICVLFADFEYPQQATGLVGTAVLDALSKSGHFQISVLSRKPTIQGNDEIATILPSVRHSVVDYEDINALVEALRGQDAVVSTIGKVSTGKAQQNLVDASVAAGVRHFIPSEFGADMKDSTIAAFPIYQSKVTLERYLEQRATQSSLCYTYIYNNIIFEFGLRTGSIIDIKNRRIHLYDGGQHLFTSARLCTIGLAVVEILLRPTLFANKAVRIGDIQTSQQKILDSARKLMPDEQWTVLHVDTKQLVQDVQPDIAAHNFNFRVFSAYATRGAFGSDLNGCYKEMDNDLLGIRPRSEPEIEQELFHIQ